MTPGVYLAHVPWYSTVATDFQGTDVLVSVWEDGTAEVTLREGHDQTRLMWGPPATLEVAP